MTIHRNLVSEPILGKIEPHAAPNFCPKCLKMGLKGADYVLRPRIYDLKPGDVLPNDADRWLQCYVCGTCYPKHDIPQVGSLTTDVETIYSKFPLVKTTEDVLISEEPLPPDKDPKKGRRGFNPRYEENRGIGEQATQQRLIKDEELKKELRRGARLLSYSEY